MFPLYNQFLAVLASSVPPAPPERDGVFSMEFFIVMIIMVVAFVFLIQRPQAKEREERMKALEGIKKGDKVVSAGGIHGVVSKLNKEKDTVFVEVAKGVELEFNKNSVVVQAPPKPKEEKAEDKKKGK